MFRLFKAVTSLLLTCLSANTLAECDGNIRLVPTSTTIESYDSNEIWIPIKLEIDEQLQSCADTVYLSSSNSGPILVENKGRKLRLDIFSKNKKQLLSISNHYILKLSKKEATQFWLRSHQSNKNRTIRSGIYNGQIDVKVNSHRAVAKHPQLTFKINPKASIRILKGKNVQLSGVGNYVVADLGELKTNSKHSLRFLVSSNANVKVAVSSQYGYLRHQQRGDKKISYSLKLNGHQLPRSNSGELDFGEIRKTKNIPLDVTLGNTDYAIAGTYQETLSVTVNAY